MTRFRRVRVASATAFLATLCTLASLDAFAAASTPPVDVPAHVHQHAHVHGVAKLGIAVQDQTVTISLESPLDSLIGFEYAATTPAQKTIVDALRARMKAPQDLFRFDAGAACTLSKSEAESAIFQPAPANSAAPEHADLDATFEFTCAHPDKLTTLDVALFQIYPKLKKLDVDVATGKGQFKRDLASPQRTISLIR